MRTSVVEDSRGTVSRSRPAPMAFSFFFLRVDLEATGLRKDHVWKLPDLAVSNHFVNLVSLHDSTFGSNGSTANATDTDLGSSLTSVNLDQ